MVEMEEMAGLVLLQLQVLITPVVAVEVVAVMVTTVQQEVRE